MTFAYYAGPEAVKGLQKFHDKAEKVRNNALKKLDGILMPDFYKKVAAEMQEGETTLKIITEIVRRPHSWTVGLNASGPPAQRPVRST